MIWVRDRSYNSRGISRSSSNEESWKTYVALQQYWPHDCEEKYNQYQSFATSFRLIRSWALFGVVAARKPYLRSLNVPARARTLGLENLFGHGGIVGRRRILNSAALEAAKRQSLLFVAGSGSIGLEIIVRLEAIWCSFATSRNLEESPILEGKDSRPTSLNLQFSAPQLQLQLRISASTLAPR